MQILKGFRLARISRNRLLKHWRGSAHCRNHFFLTSFSQSVHNGYKPTFARIAACWRPNYLIFDNLRGQTSTVSGRNGEELEAVLQKSKSLPESLFYDILPVNRLNSKI
jgi:hypothetical protein